MTEHTPTPTPENDAINRAFPDRSAGRWCGRCEQHGTHHTDRHVEFARAAIAQIAALHPCGDGTCDENHGEPE